MGIYSRAGSANLWCSYVANGRSQQESTGTADKRAAAAYLARRRKEVAAGTWEPVTRDRVDPNKPTLRVRAEAWMERREKDGVKTASDEAARLKTYVLPKLGDRPFDEIKRVEVRDLLAEIQRSPSPTTGKPIAPRTVLHIYGALRVLYADAIIDEIVDHTPCTLKVRKGELPKKRDKDPRWRALNVYTRDEAEALISDERIPFDRRIFYALGFFTGMRANEIAGRTWRDYDEVAKPLGRLLVATQGDDDEETKTLAPREVPVHAELAKLLKTWRRTGFPQFFGRHPRPDDWILPSRAGIEVARGKKMLERMKEDLERLDLRTTGRGRHAMRSTFISLGRVDGAPRDVLRTVTHDGPGDVFDGYTKWPWPTLCEAVAKLNLTPRSGVVVEMKARKR